MINSIFKRDPDYSCFGDDLIYKTAYYTQTGQFINKPLYHNQYNKEGQLETLPFPRLNKSDPNCLSSRLCGVFTALVITLISPFAILLKMLKLAGKTVVGISKMNINHIKHSFKKVGYSICISFSRVIIFPFVLIISAFSSNIWPAIAKSIRGRVTLKKDSR